MSSWLGRIQLSRLTNSNPNIPWHPGWFRCQGIRDPMWAKQPKGHKEPFCTEKKTKESWAKNPSSQKKKQSICHHRKSSYSEKHIKRFSTMVFPGTVNCTNNHQPTTSWETFLGTRHLAPLEVRSRVLSATKAMTSLLTFGPSSRSPNIKALMPCHAEDPPKTPWFCAPKQLDRLGFKVYLGQHPPVLWKNPKGLLDGTMGPIHLTPLGGVKVCVYILHTIKTGFEQRGYFYLNSGSWRLLRGHYSNSDDFHVGTA